MLDSVNGKLLTVFRTSWVCETTFSTVYFMNSQIKYF